MVRALVISLCIAVTASPAFADDKAKAKQLFEEGLRHYNLADYAQAINAWKESYLLSKAPLLLFSIGQAHRLSGDCPQAMRFYENYKREAGPNPKNKAELEDAIKLCAGKPAKTEPPKVEPPKTEPPRIEPPKTEPPKIEPPKTEPPSISSPASPPKTTADIMQPPVDEEDEEEPRDEPVRPGRTMRFVGIGVGTVGVALGTAGLFFAVQSGKTSNELDGHMGPWTMKERDLEAKGERQEKLAMILGATGAAAIVTGGVLYFLGARAGKEAPAVSITPTDGGAGVTLSGRF